MKRLFYRTVTVLIFMTLSSGILFSKTGFRVEPVNTSLVQPWGMAFLPDGTILVTEKRGRLWLVTGDTKSEVTGVPAIAVTGQGGLLDVAVHPGFEQNGLIYLSHSVSEGHSRLGTAVTRAKLTGNRLSDSKRIYVMNRLSSRVIHFGSRLAFLPDGSLLVTLGERGMMNRAQDKEDHAGSVMLISNDNKASVYSYGHRNPQGLAVNSRTGDIWLTEHGPKGGDELNLIHEGKNYGWPLVTYGVNYNGSVISDRQKAPGLEDPVLQWTPSIAPSGLTYYDGEVFPEWRDSLFAGALKFKEIRRLKLKGTEVVSEEVIIKNTYGRIRDVKTGPDGYIYFVTDEKRGGLYRIVPE